ncbi:TetR/AcrR family transcriptional regulator [Egicoccus halophilus]|uniref:TetR family transcriptional regulator n=1 Tax=Egicoccus halophilus TaxID=1670830 RepID=A0A8J3ABX2_9ACTN|nr:TetR/AcrR family transcriptional regulator [Egicoccus halophilus]GGI07970.1 TetR family transcriptional regulator [Egicoccus halophilus]
MPRRRLLDAADELFYAHGIVNTGVDALLKRAGVARKSLYDQFGGKDGLIVAYLQERDERWQQHLERVITATPDADGRLLAVFDALEQWDPSPHRRRGCAFLDALVEVADPDHPASAAVADHWRTLRTRLTELASEAGVADAAALAEELELLYRGALTTLMTEPAAPAVARARRLAAARLATAPRAGT